MYHKTFAFLLSIMLLFTLVPSIAPNAYAKNEVSIEWENTYEVDSDISEKPVKTKDGGYLYVSLVEKDEEDEIYALKVNEKGKKQWSATIDTTRFFSEITAYQETADEGVIIMISKNNEIYLVKLDDDGKEEWNRLIETDSAVNIVDIQETEDHGYVIAGATHSDDLYVSKLKEDGQIEWEKTYSDLDVFVNERKKAFHISQTNDKGYVAVFYSDPFDSADGSIIMKLDSTGKSGKITRLQKKNIIFNEVVQTEDGGLLLVGLVRGSNPKLYATKLDAKGSQKWERIGKSHVGLLDTVKEADNGDILLAGAPDYSRAVINIMVLDRNGKIKLEKNFGESISDFDVKAVDMIASKDGGTVILSSYEIHLLDIARLHVTKFNKSGKLEWESKMEDISASTFFPMIREKSDGGYIANGYSLNDRGRGHSIVFALDKAGKRQWEKDIDGEVNDLVETKDNGFLLGGKKSDSLAFVAKLTADSVQELSSFTLSAGSVTLNEMNETEKLIATANYDGNKTDEVTEEVKWTSNDTGVVRVDKGVVTAIGEGRTSIEASYLGNKIEIPVSVIFREGVVWERLFEDKEASSVYPTSDGGYIVAGIDWGEDRHDIFVLKVSKSGDKEWEKINVQQGSEFDATIRQTTDGGYILAANTEINEKDYTLLQKLDKSGKIKWEIRYDGRSSISIEQTADGGYVLPSMEYVLKVDKSGKIQWKTYLKRWAGMVKQTVDGGYIVGGEKLTKLNKSGKIEWEKQTPLYVVERTDDGGFIGNEGPYLKKISQNGEVEWEKVIKHNGAMAISSIKPTQGGYIIAAGVFDVETEWEVTRLIKVDTAGNKQWEEIYGIGRQELPGELQLTKDGGYIIAGQSYDGAWLIKIKLK